MGTPHQIPSEQRLKSGREKIYEKGIRRIHSEKKVMIMGINVSPAPLSTPWVINMDEKTT